MCEKLKINSSTDFDYVDKPIVYVKKFNEYGLKIFDGKTYVFEIGNEKTRRVYSYWEPENEQYQNPEMVEIKNVRSILASINSEFNLWDYFVKFRDRLPSGSYSYGMINMVKI